ncbi:NAD(P)-dependent oxidoreductase [bacterium]|nr:NAD(P)-dependent oxidoreductase [bacterium]
MAKNVLFTGALGFLGQHLLDYNKRFNIISKENIYLLTSRAIEGYNSILHNNYTFKSDDLINTDTLVLMGAFCPKVRSDINNIKENVKTISTLGYLLDNLANIPRKIIYLSTISVYGSKLINYNGLIDEETKPSPDFLYGHSKLMSEEILKEFCHKNNIELSILRIGVSYGANDNLRKGTIPTLVKSILKGEELNIYNEVSEIKHFIHTDDISRMILQSVNQKTDEVINLVDNKAFSVIELIKMIEKISNKKAKLIFKTREQSNDSIFNNSLMLKNFQTLKVPLEEGLEGVIEYYSNL